MRREAGFTLLETIVMLVVVGLIVAGLAQGTRVGLSTWTEETRWSRAGFDDETARRALRGLLVQMNPGNIFAGFRPVTAEAHALSFATLLPALPPGLRSREATVSIELRGHDLLLIWTARTPAPLRPPAAHADVLMGGIAALAFAYWTRGAWEDHFVGPGVPALVRIRITRERAGPPIPDLVAAPFRGAPA